MVILDYRRLIAYFGHLLRYNIKNTGMFATVKEEMDNAYSLVQVYSYSL